jgi:hypothetical protein
VVEDDLRQLRPLTLTTSGVPQAAPSTYRSRPIQFTMDAAGDDTFHLSVL